MPINLPAKIAPSGAFTVMVEGENLGSVAEGDMYFGTDGSAGMTRLAIGENAQVLTLVGGKPAWAAAAGAEVNDLGASVTWANIPIANVPTGTTSSHVALGNHFHNDITGTTNVAFSINTNTTGSDFAIVNENGVGTDGQGCWLYSPTGGVTNGTYEVRMPGEAGTLALTSELHAQNTDTGTASPYFTVDNDASDGKFSLVKTPGGTNHKVVLTNTATTADITLTLPNITATLASENYVDQATESLQDDLDMISGTENKEFTLDHDSSTGRFKLAVGAEGTNHTVTLETTATTKDQTIILPDNNGTLVLTRDPYFFAHAILFG